MENKRKFKIKDNVWVTAVIVGLLLSVISFIILLNIEKNKLTNYERGIIYVATKNIPEGTAIDEGNYFVQKELDKKVIPKSAISSPEQLKGLVAVYTIDEGTLITAGMFESINEITRDMTEPVIAGFKVKDEYQVVGGTLRAGDRINIYSVDDENAAKAIWSNMYVQQVFDSAGTNITNQDNKSVAERINIYIDNSNVEQFYSDMTEESIRIVKICE